MSFEKVGFIGLGLIGGSIAKTIKKKYPDTTLIATARHADTIQEAHNFGTIENDTLLPLSDFADCDYIFLCTPVQQNLIYLKELKSELADADAVLSLACGDGTQTIVKNLKNIPVYPANNTMFIGETKRIGEFEEACKACGDCELGWTGGICPVTMCAKGLINGACGGAKNGKCEVSQDNDCAWVKIYERLKDIDQLDNLLEIRPMKDYSKQNNPRSLNLKEKQNQKTTAKA